MQFRKKPETKNIKVKKSSLKNRYYDIRIFKEYHRPKITLLYTHDYKKLEDF